MLLHRPYMRGQTAFCRIAVAILASLLFGRSAAGGPLRTVALTGQFVPGTTTGETFQGLHDLQINSRGKVAFTSSGIWTDASGELERVVQSTDPAPGLPAGTVVGYGLTMHAMNRSGQLAFWSSIAGPGITGDSDETVWSTASGVPAIVARDGDPAPGLPAGSTYYYVWVSPALNDAGQTLFGAGIRAPGGTSPQGGGLWMESGGVRTAVAHDGMHLPGMPVGAVLRHAPISAPWNRAGQVVFPSDISPPLSPGVYENGVWQGSAGNLRLVTKSGVQAPGAAPGTVFSTFGFSPAQNHFGQVAFSTTLSGTGVTAANDMGIWRERAGGLELAWREGVTPSGVPAGVLFSSSDARIVGFNELGHIAVTTTLDGAGVTAANDRSLWVHRDDAFRLIVREGDDAPGIAGDATFANFSAPGLNSTGSLAFFATITGSGVSSAAGNDLGIWVGDAAGDLQLIARTGNPIEIAPGDWRIPTDLNINFDREFEPTNVGRSTGFNDRGQVAFQATFSDGTKGIFVSDAAATIPGDFNRDGSVNGADLTIWRSATAGPTATPNLYADGDFDGDVDGDDMLVWQRNLGATTPASSAIHAIPEPTAALLAASAMALAGRRRVPRCDART